VGSRQLCCQASAEARRNQLMRDMAQLRLQDEVTRLEGSLTGGADETGSSLSGTTLLPPYVVPDGRTLCDHLTVVKQLAASSRFITIIPIDGQLLTVLSLIVLSFHHRRRRLMSHSETLTLFSLRMNKIDP